MQFELFWKPQDSYNERARIGFWVQTKKKLVHFALTWYRSDCFFRCFVFKKRGPPFKYAFSLSMGALQAMIHYNERPSVPSGLGYTGCT